MPTAKAENCIGGYGTARSVVREEVISGLAGENHRGFSSETGGL